MSGRRHRTYIAGVRGCAWIPVAAIEGNVMRNVRGISLVDLVTTMVALTLLFAMAVPLLGQAQDSNNRRQCAANVRGIMQSMNVYGADNGDMFPFIGGDSATTYVNTVKAQE